MHRELQELLKVAQGTSEFSIVIFIDIRGFSLFSQRVESPDSAMFIKRVYSSIINDYFPDAAFFKPTGDGLMIIVKYTEDTLAEVSAKVTLAAVKCVEEFKDICTEDPMINFEVPRMLGIGISRGTACRLHAGEKTLDYSGRLLNLTARLTAIARPNGVVIDGDFRRGMIADEIRSRFLDSEVYLRGIAEFQPKHVFLLDAVTSVPRENKAPIDSPDWKVVRIEKSYRILKQLAPRFAIKIPSKPDSDNIVVVMKHTLFRKGKRVKDHFTDWSLKRGIHWEFQTQASTWNVIVLLDVVLKDLANLGMSDREKITFIINYTDS